MNVSIHHFIFLDFSSSFREHQVIQGIVQSRFYRAPEVLLGIMPLSLPIDMWSLGCILFEMHTGEALIEGWRDEEQIFLISEVSFLFPVHSCFATPVYNEFYLVSLIFPP